jgi:hypothetical protein
MPNPIGPRDFKADPVLTNALIGYRHPMRIADLLFPRIRTTERGGIIGKVKQSDFFRNNAALRATGDKSRRGGFRTDITNTYFCQRYSWGEEIADDDRRASMGSPFDLDVLKSKKASDALSLQREIALAAAYFTTSKWGADKVAGTDYQAWSDYAGSSPLTDVADWKDQIEGKIGSEGNVLTLGKQVWVKLRWHPDLIDSIKHTQVGQVSEALAAQLMELEQLLIGRSIYTTSSEDTAEASVSYSRVWGKHALVTYRSVTAAAPPIGDPTAGLTITWDATGIPDALEYIKRMRDEEREVDIFEVNSYYAQVQTESRAGIFAQNAVA